MSRPGTNFSHLGAYDEQLVRLGMLAERYFADDPNTCLLKLRQLTEVLAQFIATRVGIYTSVDEKQVDLLRRLQDHGILPREVGELFYQVRKAGNAANHQISGDHRSALMCLRLVWQISVWFHRTFSDSAFKSGAFLPPEAPKDESAELKAELDQLQAELAQYRTAHKEATELLDVTKAQVKQTQEDRAFWENMAAEADSARNALTQHLAALQSQAAALPTKSVVQFVDAANAAVKDIQLNEADTRKLIDSQLCAAGWMADSGSLTFAKGARPEKGKHLAIAEWPTESGPADYVLFIGFQPVAIIEAKRKNIDVSAALQQAKRYSRHFKPSAEVQLQSVNWGEKGEFRVPFVFSTNGRPYLKQLETKSGVWFCDLRRPDNLARALDGWYQPEGLSKLLKTDEALANKKLAAEPFNYGFQLRPYQQTAIRSIETAIERGQRAMLLAMATGTGKTKTCIALIYRLLKTERFRRILFLVDRSALGEQAANAFKDTRMESLQTFADIFGIKELEDVSPDSSTTVHIATVQGMVKRLLYASDTADVPSVDQYDCIVVDECHRGYLLDRELSDTEMVFRGYEDYISKYRRVLEYFDAIKVGLTATPALHTTQIFGNPVYTYSYREAVIDGFLVDYEPPIQIHTQLSTEGIKWKVGESVQVYDPRKDKIQLFNAPDDIQLDIEEFNRKVITESFNRVVCEQLANELDPNGNRKTLVFCVTDAHADLVVKLLKEAFTARYGSVDDDAVIKITGAADKPLQLIRRYKNERNPSVAVTVDLLTTGIDVPKICNLVFLRRVNSRILFDQMLGRATRLCEEIDKDSFRVFDAVRIFEAIKNMTAMQPVVINPSISFTQLVTEMATVKDEAAQALVRDQMLAKLQRKKHHLSEKSAHDFETTSGLTPDQFIRKLRNLPLNEVAEWFANNPDLGEILDRKGDGPRQPIFISQHEDSLVSVERGYGNATKPQDYLKEFSDFIRSHSNTIPALITVLKRPRELTRKQLRELALELDKAGFTETGLSTAWREATNQEIAARIVGFIRQAAIGDALVSYEERVDRALQKVLASRNWTTPQRDWLKKIAAQTKANTLVDREALDEPDLLFKTQGGGFNRLDKLFEGQLLQTLEAFNDAVWAQPGSVASKS